MFCECLKAPEKKDDHAEEDDDDYVEDEDDYVVDGDEVEWSSPQNSHNLTTQEISNDHKSISQSFSKCIWQVLNQLSFQQLLQTSQNYIHLHLRNHGILSLQPSTSSSTKEVSEMSSQERDISLSCLLPNQPNQRAVSIANSNTLSITSSDVAESPTPNALFDDTLDEYENPCLIANMTMSTDDGFNILSRRVMSQGLEEYYKKISQEEEEKKEEEEKEEKEEKEKEIQNKEARPKKVMMNIMTTDDGMQQLAKDCMSISLDNKKKNVEENKDDIEDQEKKMAEEDEDEGVESEIDDYIDEEEKQDKHREANHRMLHNLNMEILGGNHTPGFFSPISEQ